MQREKMEPLPFHEMLSRFKAVYSKKHCLHPDHTQCKGQIIKAHTVPKSGSLRKIAREGKVCQFRPSLLSLKKSGGKLEETLVGVNDASTFTGFCVYHDNKLFEPIEQNVFRADAEAAFLLTYRAICRELFVKQKQATLIPKLKDFDKGLPKYMQGAMQQYLSSAERGAAEGLRILNRHKGMLDIMLLSNKYGTIKYYIIRLTSSSEVMASGSVCVEFDFQGRQIQPQVNIGSSPDIIAFSVIGTEDGGAVVFSWIDEQFQACTNFVKSLREIPLNEQGNAIIRFLFTHCENVFFSPAWWEALDESKRAAIRSRMNIGIRSNNLPNSVSLKDDRLDFVSWDVSSVDTNVAGLED